MERAERKQTSPWIVALAWVVVAIPLGWGVYTSINKALPLFQMGPTPIRKP